MANVSRSVNNYDIYNNRFRLPSNEKTMTRQSIEKNMFVENNFTPKTWNYANKDYLKSFTDNKHNETNFPTQPLSLMKKDIPKIMTSSLKADIYMNKEEKPVIYKKTMRRSDLLGLKDDKTNKSIDGHKSNSVVKDKHHRNRSNGDRDSIDQFLNPYNLLSPKDDHQREPEIIRGNKDIINRSRIGEQERINTEDNKIYGLNTFKNPSEIIDNVQKNILNKINSSKNKKVVLQDYNYEEEQLNKFFKHQATPNNETENVHDTSNEDLIVSGDYTNILQNIKQRIDDHRTKFKSILSKNSAKAENLYNQEINEMHMNVYKPKHKATNKKESTIIDKYDKVKAGKAQFTHEQEEGYAIFKANCASCHTEPLFTDGSFRNNGLIKNPFTKDAGRMSITGKSEDSLKFRVPSLRNLFLTFPSS